MTLGDICWASHHKNKVTYYLKREGLEGLLGFSSDDEVVCAGAEAERCDFAVGLHDERLPCCIVRTGIARVTLTKHGCRYDE